MKVPSATSHSGSPCCDCGIDMNAPNAACRFPGNHPKAPPSATRPSMLYVWLVPSEEVLEQPGHWRIRKWDTEPFPEANFVASQSRRVVAQGPCETTMTPRFQIPDCNCGTYEGNLGPCLTWWEGNNVGKCVYCEHGLDCHVKLSKLLASEKPQADPKNANLAALVLKLDKHISLHGMFAPEWEVIVAEAKLAPSSTRYSELAERLEAIAAKATPGPWAWDQRGEKINEWGMGVALTKDEKPIAGYFKDEDAIYVEHVCSTEGATLNYHDPKLICELRNNLPEIIAALRGITPSAIRPIEEAALHYINIYEGWMKCDDTGAALNAAFNALREACGGVANAPAGTRSANSSGEGS